MHIRLSTLLARRCSPPGKCANHLVSVSARRMYIFQTSLSSNQGLTLIVHPASSALPNPFVYPHSSPTTLPLSSNHCSHSLFLGFYTTVTRCRISTRRSFSFFPMPLSSVSLPPWPLTIISPNLSLSCSMLTIYWLSDRVTSAARGDREHPPNHLSGHYGMWRYRRKRAIAALLFNYNLSYLAPMQRLIARGHGKFIIFRRTVNTHYYQKSIPIFTTTLLQCIVLRFVL